MTIPTEKIKEMFDDCQMKDRMCEAFGRLDESAKNDFESYLRKVVDILCDNEERIEIRICAAKEFHRQLTSRSKSFAPIQMKKWNGLDSRTKEYVQNKLIAALASLNSADLVEPLQNAILTIVASWSDCTEEIASICTNGESSMHALTASFNVLGNIAKPGSVSISILEKAFEIGLKKVGTNYSESAFNDMQYATLTFITKFLRKWMVHKQGVSQSEWQFLDQLYKTIEEAKVLLNFNEHVCNATIKLLTEILSMQQQLPLKNRNDVKKKLVETV